MTIYTLDTAKIQRCSSCTIPIGKQDQFWIIGLRKSDKIRMRFFCTECYTSYLINGSEGLKILLSPPEYDRIVEEATAMRNLARGVKIKASIEKEGK